MKEHAVVRRAEYEPTNNPVASQAGQRTIFMQTLCEIMPQVIESVRTDILPLYLAVNEDDRVVHSADLRIFSDSLKSDNPYPKPDPYDEVAAAIADWLQHWKLNTSWMRTCVVYSFVRWSYIPKLPLANLDWKAALGSEMPRGKYDDLLKTTHMADLTVETRSDAKKRIEKLFQVELREYLDRRDSQAREHGVKKVRNTSKELHHRWLIEHHLQGHNFTEIARRHNKGSSDGAGGTEVSLAIRKLAAHLVLPLRSSRPGRPTKMVGK